MTSPSPRASTSRPQRPPEQFNPARELAVRVLLRVLAGEAFASGALDSALQAARKGSQVSGRDAGLATQIVYGTLRHLRSLEAALAPLLTGETHPKTRAVLLAGTFEKLHLRTPTHAVVNEYVNLSRTARLAPPGLVNAVLRRVEAPTGPVSELPQWVEDSFRWAYGPQTQAVLDDLQQPQPLWLSVSETGTALLEQEGSTVTPGPQGVDRIELARPLRESEAYQRGEAQPINPASMACVNALCARVNVDGLRVLDLAGGVGIKAAMLATCGAKVLSVDKAKHKHAAARANLTRLGLSAEFLTHDLTQPLDLPPAAAVLLDAPCTGSGTLRSHPEIKLRLTPETVAEMSALQARMLPNAAALVAPGGVLVYSVCSVMPAEGPEVIRDFLAQHPEFSAEEVTGIEVPFLKVGDGILTVPVGGIDGFFIARLRRSQ